MNNHQEVWLKLPGTIYSISNFGNIRNDNNNYIKSKYLTPDGYHTVGIGKRTKQVHRLVAKLFLDDYSEELVVNHKDFNRTNNHVSNLEMCTVKENAQYSASKGRYKRYGELNNNCKYDNAVILMIKTYLNLSMSCADIARITGLDRRYVNGIKLGRRG